MRVTREQADANRERIIDTASQLFREKGFDGIGVADLMRAAGLTHGGFYGHFASKDDLAARACERSFAIGNATWNGVIDDATANGSEPMAEVAARYLSAEHRDAPGLGCTCASLGSDAARQSQPVRRSFTEGVRSLVATMQRAVERRGERARRRAAIVTLSELVGAMTLARAVDDDELASEILDATTEHLTAFARRDGSRAAHA